MSSNEKNGPDHPLERMIFFSDAVFAIAITLLIIEVHPPHLHDGASNTEYLQALVNLLPNLPGFFISFFVIGAFWAAHHRAFALAGHHSDRLNWPNLMMLCSIVFMPFSTAFMSANYGALVPSLLYNAVLVVTGLLNIRLIRIVTSPPVVDERVSAEAIAYVRARAPAVVLGGICALLVALWDVRFSQAALLTIPVWIYLLRRQTRIRLASGRAMTADQAAVAA